MRLLTLPLLLLACAGFLRGETVTWSPGQPIDLPLEITIKPDVIHSRTVTFPGGKLQPVIGNWNKGDLEIDLVAHKATFVLNSATLTSPVHLHDDQGNTFTVMVRPETARRLEPELIVEDGRNLSDNNAGGTPGVTSSGTSRIVDSYSEITRMYRSMMGRQCDSDVHIQEQLTRNAAGTMIAGEVLDDADDMRTTLLRVFQGPAITGYEVLVEWKRDYPVILNIQQLTIDPKTGSSNLLAVGSDKTVIMPSSGPAPTILEKGKGVRVFLLEERGE